MIILLLTIGFMHAQNNSSVMSQGGDNDNAQINQDDEWNFKPKSYW